MIHPKRLPFLAAALLGAVLALPARAAEGDFGPAFTLQMENDWFARASNVISDRDYTTGLRLAWISGAIDTPDWLKGATALPAVFGSQGNNAVRRWGLSLNQNIYTPRNTDERGLIRDDRPYAAWLFVGLTLQAIYREDDTPVRMDTFDLSLGVVGPAALGRQVQSNFHELIGDDKARGWRNQLKNEPAIQLTFERRWRTGAASLFRPLGLEIDAVPYVGAGLGNVQTYASAGGIVRIGQSLRKDFGPPRSRPSLPGSEAFNNDGFSWYLFAGAEGQAVARNIFLDGNTFRDSHKVDKHPAVGELQAGLALFFGGVRLAYTHVLRTPEFKERDRFQQYGSVSLAFSF